MKFAFSAPLAGTAALLALLIAGCGGTPSQPAAEPARLVLDFAPNAVHSGIFLTHQRGWDRAAGVDLQIRSPASSSDSLKLLLSGGTDFALLDIHDLAIADQSRRGQLVALMAIVERPLAALLADPSIHRPSDLQGKRAGVTGLPSDSAVLNSIVAGDGGNPALVEKTTIGFQAVAAMVSGRVSAATAFWNVEGQALRARRPSTRQFRVEDYGAPAYPELLLVTRRRTLTSDPEMVDATTVALKRGYEATIAAPTAAAAALVAGAPGVNLANAKRELSAVLPAFKKPGEEYGSLDRATLEAWAIWEQRFGIVRRRPVVDELFSGPLVIGNSAH